MKQNMRIFALYVIQGGEVFLCLAELIRIKPLSAFVALGVAWLAMRMEEM